MRTSGIVFGVLALLILGFTLFLALGQWRWRARTRALARTLSRPGPTPTSSFSAADLDTLPAPVARYFRAVLPPGQRLVRSAHLRQKGRFLLRPTPDGWRPFTAEQHFCTSPPGFVWDARIRMGPGLSVGVRDAFVDGEGSMVASLFGWFHLANTAGTPEIAAASLQRYLAEATWLPTALLPASGVRWEPLEERSARAHLSAGNTHIHLDFRFGADGLVESIYTAARGRDVGGQSVPTPWEGRFFDYVERGGLRFPLRGEVGWWLPAGYQPYWQGEITAATYDFGPLGTVAN